MGASASSGNAASLHTAIVVAKGGQRQKIISELADKYKLADEQDFYELFGLDRYCKIGKKEKKTLLRRFNRLILRWHPDKNAPEDKEACNIWTAKLYLARNVLLDRDLKRRYDAELQRQRSENGRWSAFQWYFRWGCNILQVLGGIAAIVCGSTGVVAAGGAVAALTICGSMALSAGLRGSARMHFDSQCSTTEYLKDLGVGALQGVVGGAIGAGAGAVIQGATVAARTGQLMAVGATMYGSGHVISDTADIMISDGHLGQEIKENVPGAKTANEVFSADNYARFAAGCALGPFLGPVAQGPPREVRVVCDDPQVAPANLN